jgi:hypothetical protein
MDFIVTPAANGMAAFPWIMAIIIPITGPVNFNLNGIVF